MVANKRTRQQCASQEPSQKSKISGGALALGHWVPLCTAKVSVGVLHNMCISN